MAETSEAVQFAAAYADDSAEEEEEEMPVAGGWRHTYEPSHGTVHQYRQAVARCARVMGLTLADVRADPMSLSRALEEYEPKRLHTHNLVYASFIHVLKQPGADRDLEAVDALQEQHSRVTEALRELYDANGMTAKQRESWLPWKSVVSAYESISDTNVDQLWMGVYVLQPPRRLEFRTVRQVDGPVAAGDAEGKNLLVYVGGKPSYWLFGDYKTRRKYGVHQQDVNPPLAAVIMRHAPKEYNGQYLFGKGPDRAEAVTRSWFGRRLKDVLMRYCKKPATNVTLRHSLITSLDRNKLSYGTLKRIASMMGHSVAMQARYNFIDAHDE